MQLAYIKDASAVEKTFPCPTRVDPYGEPAVSVFIPADGTPVVQNSNARGATGDTAGVRSLFWDAFPESAPSASPIAYTGTLAILKALEGVSTQLKLGSAWGGLYYFYTTITVLRVSPRSIGFAGGRAWYSLTLEYIET